MNFFRLLFIYLIASTVGCMYANPAADNIAINVFDNALRIQDEAGVDCDYVKNIVEMRKRAEKGDMSAYLELADIYLSNALCRNIDMAIEILKYIANKPTNGKPEMQHLAGTAAIRLGDIHSGNLLILNELMKKDFKEAEKWYNKAIFLGEGKARIFLSYIYSNNDNPAKDYEVAKEHLSPLLDKKGYDIARFEYEFLCFLQTGPKIKQDGQKAFIGENGNIDYDALIKSVKDGNFEAQVYLAQIYLGEQELSIAVPAYNMFYGAKDKILECREKLGINKETGNKLALKTLRESAIMGNPKGTLMYALMLTNGIGAEKNIAFAKDLMARLRIKYEDARFFYELYFAKLNINKLNLSHMAQRIVPIEETPYTFYPEESYEWTKKIKCDENYHDSCANFRLKDANLRLRDIPEGYKKLMPFQAVAKLVGLITDDGDNTYVVDPAQSNAFFENNNVCVNKYKVWTEPDMFSYKIIGKLEGGIQILHINLSGGGSLNENYIYFLAMQKIDVLHDNMLEKGLPVLTNLGHICNYSAKYMKTMHKGNVFILYRIYSDLLRDNESFTNDVTIISFETDKELESKHINSMMREMFSFRKETCPE